MRRTEQPVQSGASAPAVMEKVLPSPAGRIPVTPNSLTVLLRFPDDRCPTRSATEAPFCSCSTMVLVRIGGRPPAGVSIRPPYAAACSGVCATSADGIAITVARSVKVLEFMRRPGCKNRTHQGRSIDRRLLRRCRNRIRFLHLEGELLDH